jgi:hypothetical protein
MSARPLPGFTAESSLEQPAGSGAKGNWQRQYRTAGRQLHPGNVGSATVPNLIPAVECSTGVPGTLSVEEYNGSYYVCCCPDDFRKPCQCTGIV